MNNFKRKIEEFFRGRYGTDQLSVFMSFAGLIFIIGASAFASPELSAIISGAGLAFLILSSLRVLSKNTSQRQKENNTFLSIFGKKGSSNNDFSYEKSDKREKREQKEREKAAKKAMKEKLKTHALFYCPNCKCKCFVPKGKGKVRITCPKCGEKFIGKT
ncbi:MAG: IBR domain-containing protein, partial [Sphaerochaetaceae bacterium]|nr:IBR domain-containing protein [Sphaerochaetaceae bacterium]